MLTYFFVFIVVPAIMVLALMVSVIGILRQGNRQTLFIAGMSFATFQLMVEGGLSRQMIGTHKAHLCATISRLRKSAKWMLQADVVAECDDLRGRIDHWYDKVPKDNMDQD